MSKFDPIAFSRRNISYFSDQRPPQGADLNGVNYVLQGNGVWEIRKNKIATFTKQISKVSLLGFPEPEIEDGVELHVPKIPKELLDETIEFFKEICKRSDHEAYIQFVYNEVSGEYRAICPEQLVSKGSVHYDPVELSQEEILVCEIHSHNSMAAFFSSVDDEDEMKRGDRFFGVVGELDTAYPAVKMSFIVGGRQRVYIEVGAVFEIPATRFPAEWLDKISERKYELTSNEGHFAKYDKYGNEEGERTKNDRYTYRDADDNVVTDTYEQIDYSSIRSSNDDGFLGRFKFGGGKKGKGVQTRVRKKS